MTALSTALMVCGVFSAMVTCAALLDKLCGRIPGLVSKDEIERQKRDGLHWLPTEWREVRNWVLVTVGFFAAWWVTS